MAGDLALIAAAQKVEHYEISAYGTARAMAGQAGLPTVSELLCKSLAEEEVADNLLTQIARELIVGIKNRIDQRAAPVSRIGGLGSGRVVRMAARPAAGRAPRSCSVTAGRSAVRECTRR